MSDLHVVKRPWPRVQPEHKGHNQPLVEQGEEVYCVLHQPTGAYFYYAYLDESQAEMIRLRLENDFNASTLAGNFRAFPGSVVNKP